MEEEKPELAVIIRKIKAYVEMEKLSGVEDYLVPAGFDQKTGHCSCEEVLVPRRLAILEEEANQCQDCELYLTRKTVVFGEGNPEARLVFVGEAPGRDEDEQGRPFVGRAGQLLTRIISAMGFKRSDVYIANCLKCRPPGNRNPSLMEISTCWPYLEKQLEIIRPEIICTLGKFAGQMLLKTEDSISRFRGRFHEYGGIKVMPTFHPAYLLRNPGAKKTVWEDMKKVLAVLDKSQNLKVKRQK